MASASPPSAPMRRRERGLPAAPPETVGLPRRAERAGRPAALAALHGRHPHPRRQPAPPARRPGRRGRRPAAPRRAAEPRGAVQLGDRLLLAGGRRTVAAPDPRRGPGPAGRRQGLRCPGRPAGLHRLGPRTGRGDGGEAAHPDRAHQPRHGQPRFGPRRPDLRAGGRRGVPGARPAGSPSRRAATPRPPSACSCATRSPSPPRSGTRSAPAAVWGSAPSTTRCCWSSPDSWRATSSTTASTPDSATPTASWAPGTAAAPPSRSAAPRPWW